MTLQKKCVHQCRGSPPGTAVVLNLLLKITLEYVVKMTLGSIPSDRSSIPRPPQSVDGASTCFSWQFRQHESVLWPLRCQGVFLPHLHLPLGLTCVQRQLFNGWRFEAEITSLYFSVFNSKLRFPSQTLLHMTVIRGLGLNSCDIMMSLRWAPPCGLAGCDAADVQEAGIRLLSHSQTWWVWSLWPLTTVDPQAFHFHHSVQPTGLFFKPTRGFGVCPHSLSCVEFLYRGKQSHLVGLDALNRPLFV